MDLVRDHDGPAASEKAEERCRSFACGRVAEIQTDIGGEDVGPKIFVRDATGEMNSARHAECIRFRGRVVVVHGASHEHVARVDPARAQTREGFERHPNALFGCHESEGRQEQPVTEPELLACLLAAHQARQWHPHPHARDLCVIDVRAAL